jgi:hypothetical protein
LEDSVRAETIKGINNAIYGLMMILDGVSGKLKSPDLTVSLETKVVLSKKDDYGEDLIIHEVNLREGEGMCMGYHKWLEGDFGKDLVASKQ